MTRKDGLPRRVYLKHGRYWHVGADGKWRSLARERDGLPAMLRALADLQDGEVLGHMLPAVATRWQQGKLDAGEWEASTQRNMERVVRHVAARFADFAPGQVTTPVVFQYLRPLLDRLSGICLIFRASRTPTC